jgi:hypothetical protein
MTAPPITPGRRPRPKPHRRNLAISGRAWHARVRAALACAEQIEKTGVCTLADLNRHVQETRLIGGA